MAIKTLDTRISLRYDTLENWQKSDVAGKGANLVLNSGEMGICYVPGVTQGTTTTAPTVLFKVGDGTQTFAQLPWASGLAADVYDWAKATTKPTYTASEITGLSDFVSTNETNTQYQWVADGPNKFKLQSKEKNGSWSDVSGQVVELVQDATNGHKIGFKINGTTPTQWITIPDSDVNQTVKAGEVTFGSNDVVNFVGGGDITVTGNSTDKTITISATNPAVGDGKLTVVAGSAASGTFTANQSSDSTIVIDATTHQELTEAVATKSNATNLSNGLSDNSLQQIGNYAGCKGWECATATDYNRTNKTMTVSDASGLAVNDVMSAQFKNNFDLFGKITAISGNTLTFDVFPTLLQEDVAVAKFYVWCPAKSTIGDYILGNNAFATGTGSKALQIGSFAEGKNNTSAGKYSHTEGQANIAAYSSHAEGWKNTASGEASHAQGYQTTASGVHSHTEGYMTTASAHTAHAQGYQTTASGSHSFAGGENTVASKTAQTALGQFNNNKTNTLFEVGNGTADNARSNAFEVYKNGQVISGSETVANDNKALTTKKYVDDKIAIISGGVVFKGTLGTGGTISTLPSAAGANKGHMYKVITDGTYAGQAAKVGDLFISSGSSSTAGTAQGWYYIPSGDEPSGTVTNIATGTGLTGGPITTTGTISHATVSGGAVSASAKKVGYDNLGHVVLGDTLAAADVGADASGTAQGLINALDKTVSGMANNKTLATLTQTDGIISATFQDIHVDSNNIDQSSGDILVLNCGNSTTNI